MIGRSDFLDEIVAYKRAHIREHKAFFKGLEKNVSNSKLSRYELFKKAISKEGTVQLIAEIKKASPSKGLLCPDFDAVKLARMYTEGGAAAISVVTEDKFFQGKPLYIRQIQNHLNVPILLKDFIIDEVQIYEAFNLRASAVLLIVAILTDEELKRFQAIAHDLDLDCLVEVHTKQELTRALDAGAEIIGVNNRDLHTFEVDFKRCEELIPQIPRGPIIVAESGIKTHDEIVKLKQMGAHAVLVGETFLRCDDITRKIKDVMQG